MQQLTRDLAFAPGAWTEERRSEIARRFDDLASEWHTRGGEERLVPTRDGLKRGGIPPAGTALEVGSGTGLQTGALRDHFERVVSLDLSDAMLHLTRRVPDVALVRADAAHLPLRAGSVDAIVCVNAFLFPAEYARVLAPGGSLLFVSTSGEQTPIYLPPQEVVTALSAVLGPTRAFTSSAGWGVWTAVHRDPQTDR